MNRDDARKIWKESGLDYSVLTEDNLYALARYLNHELSHFDEWKLNCNVPNAWLCLHYIRQKPFQTYSENHKVIWAEFTMDSHYFKNRECITFNSDGFIGFAGWASDNNVQPILKAFTEWVDWVKSQPIPVAESNPTQNEKSDPLKNVKRLTEDWERSK